MDNQLALAMNQQNQQAQHPQTIILNVVEVEKRNQPRAVAGIAKSSSKGSLDVIRTSKKVQNRAYNYSINDNTNNTHTEYIQSNPQVQNSNQEKPKRSSKSKKRSNGHGSAFRNHHDIEQKGIEYARQTERKSLGGLAQQLSTKRIVEISPIGPNYQQIRDTQISAVTPQQPSSYNSANSRHKSNASSSKPSLQTIQQASGMIMISSNQPSAKVRSIGDPGKTYNEKQLTYSQMHAAQQAERVKQNQHPKGGNQALGSHPNIQKPQSIMQPNLNSVPNYTQSSLFTPNVEHQSNEQQKQRKQKRLEKSDHEVNEVQANRLQKAGQSQVHYGSASSMDPSQSQSALSKSQVSGQKNTKRRQLQEQILTSQSVPLSQKLIKHQEGSQGSNSVRKDLKQEILKQRQQEDQVVDGHQQEPPNEVRLSITKLKQKGEKAITKKKQQTVRSPSTNNLQDQISNKNPTLQRTKIVPQGQQQVQINMPLLRQNRPQSNTGDQSIKKIQDQLAVRLPNSQTTSNQPSQAQLHVKYKQANLKQKQMRGGSLAQNPSLRTDLHADQNGTTVGSAFTTHNTKQMENEAPVYKNNAPKFVPKEQLKVRQGLKKQEAEKAEKEKQNDKKNTTVGAKMFMQLKNGKPSYKVRNHILSSDSTSSDEYMYEDIVDGKFPNGKNLQYNIGQEPKETSKTEQQSKGEISNREDEGEGLWEAEEGEEEMEYEEYGDEHQAEEISNQGEEIDQGLTKNNSHDQQSESQGHKQMKQGGGLNNSEQEAGQGPKTKPEQSGETKEGKPTGQKSSDQLVRRKKIPRLIMNLLYTFYPVVKKVAKQLNL